MNPRIWMMFAISVCGAATIGAVAVTIMAWYATYQSTNILLAGLVGVLVAEGLARRVISTFVWFWPHQANADWLAKHPPLFRLDKLK